MSLCHWRSNTNLSVYIFNKSHLDRLIKINRPDFKFFILFRDRKTGSRLKD